MADFGVLEYLAITAIAVSAAGNAVSYAGAQASADAQKQAANYNAMVAMQEAEAARQAAAYEEARLREAGESLKARQRMLYLKSGVDIGEGTPLLVESDTAAKIELDAQAIRWKGSIGATSSLNQAYSDLTTAYNAKKIGQYTAGTTLLTGLSSVLGSASGYYYRAEQASPRSVRPATSYEQTVARGGM